MNKGTKESMQVLAHASSMGFAVAISIIIGLAIGYYLDKWLGTSPWLLLIFLVLGIVAAFNNIFVLYRRVQRMSEQAEESESTDERSD